MTDAYKAGYDAIDWSQPLPDKYVKPPTARFEKVQAFQFMPDTPGYYSVASDKWIDGRAARREDLKRTGCIEAGDVPRLNGGYAKNQDFARRHGLRWEGDR